MCNDIVLHCTDIVKSEDSLVKIGFELYLESPATCKQLDSHSIALIAFENKTSVPLQFSRAEIFKKAGIIRAFE